MNLHIESDAVWIIIVLLLLFGDQLRSWLDQIRGNVRKEVAPAVIIDLQSLLDEHEDELRGLVVTTAGYYSRGVVRNVDSWGVTLDEGVLRGEQTLHHFPWSVVRELTTTHPADE